MVISRIVATKSGRASLFDDNNEFFCSVSLDTLTKYGIYKGKDIPDDELQIIEKDDLENKIFSRACSYLSKSPKTEKQVYSYIKNTLQKIQVNEEIEVYLLEETINKLKEHSYINDEDYAKEFILSRIKNKPRGRILLLNELLSKGIDKEIAENALDLTLNDEYVVLENTYKKKYKEENISIEDNKKISFLLRKGFNWDLIEQFIKNKNEPTN